MSKIQPPPIADPIATVDKEGEELTTSLSWILFFNQLYTGDTGTDWTPTFTDLTQVGTPTFSGKYYKVGRLVYFSVLVTPGTNTSAVAGTTYINNFPLTMRRDGACHAVSGGLGSSSGHCVASNNRIYVPQWTTVTVPLTVVGTVEAG